MYDKKYEHPFFAISYEKFNVIVMSGTGDDDGNDNVITGIDWTGGGLG